MTSFETYRKENLEKISLRASNFKEPKKNFSSYSYKGGAESKLLDFNKTSQSWQREAWAVYDCVPEVKFSAEFIGANLSKARFRLAKSDGTRLVEAPEIVRFEEPVLNELFLTNSAGGGHSIAQMVRVVAINLVIAGEIWLIKSHDERGFKVIPCDIIERRGDSLGVSGNSGFKAFRSDDVVIRIYRPHPKNPDLATSNLASCLPQAKNLVMLDKLIAATAKSNMANGIFLVPTEIDFIPENPEDTLTDVLYDHLTEPINDLDSAASVAPMVIEAASEYLDDFEHFTFNRDFDEHLTELRKQEIERIARGLDLPTELVLGIANLNHWATFSLSNSFIRSHAIPMLQLIADALTTKILHPTLQKGNVADYQKYCVTFDETSLVTQPNKTANAIDAYKLGALSPEALLKYLGFNPDDIADIVADPGTPRTSEGVQTDRGDITEGGVVDEPN